ncbi:MAG: hypothetical protein ACJAQT_004640 [Akkermansiaceae bacterium]|jgi:hypothetical protein
MARQLIEILREEIGAVSEADFFLSWITQGEVERS